ncbi:complement C1q-like protein 4 [Mercenaria mercenaria]|uniref:complement C1q-like protein 4 n=1 Tax=Mercenaria mercenaria TaxID=6596 RepID=UPI001E1E16FE|nr:complement C1q-like protein 4 [Mercenaria mercenaria]
MEKDFLKRETDLLQEINQLKDKYGDDGITLEEDQENEDAQNGYTEFIQHSEKEDTRSPLKERRSSIVREAVETEVAFYATHTQHDIRHLGQGQIIAFDQTVTNIGNAYNTHHGAVVAPVDGTYVFHVTLMGTLHNASNHYYTADIDVDDVGYSKFYIVPYEQSSHMFVIELKSGSAVSVKNGRVDDGIIGKHYSAFSGFLLYQHFQPPAVVGK